MITQTHPSVLQQAEQLLNRLRLQPTASLFPRELMENKPVIFDFTRQNEAVRGLVEEGGAVFQDYVNGELDAQHTNWGIGRYMERRDGVLEGTHIANEERFYHLGIDIALPNDTPLLCPLDGEIYQTGYSPEWGDYGHFVATRHELEGIPFFLFYGHLKSGSYQTSGAVRAGQQIASLGDFEENGQWFHHTHLQICMEAWEKLTPDGYCHERDVPEYRYLNPDPGVFLRS